MWYDEVAMYNFTQPGFSSATGHFTQVVWKATTKVGCAIVISSKGKVIGVCHYTSSGNVAGQYKSNVLPK